MVDVNDTAGSRTHALVVDDDPVTRRLIKRVIERSGCDSVLEAEDGEAAQPILLQHSFDLVVTDLQMPRLDGIGLMRWAAEHAPGDGLGGQKRNARLGPRNRPGTGNRCRWPAPDDHAHAHATDLDVRCELTWRS